MAYDATKPATGGFLVSADIRENFRALKEDGIVLPKTGTGATDACAGNDARLSNTRTPTDGSVTEAKLASGAVSQAKLKTSTGSVSTTSTTAVNLTLPGGEYGFYPQLQASDEFVSITAQIAVPLYATAFVTNIAIASNYVGGTVYARQRYVTSSGEVHWVFILRDKVTKETISMYQAPDHPCFGNSGKPLLVPHPFGSYDPDKHEIIVINPSDEDVFNMQDACIMPEDKPDRDILEVIVKDYEIDEDLKTEWPKKEITVGLPKNIDWKRMPEDSKVVPVRKRIPQPSYVTTRKLWKKK